MDPGHVPEELSGLTDAEQMLISKLVPIVQVHMLKHGGIASRGHCIAFPQAVQEPARILPRLLAEVNVRMIGSKAEMILTRTSGSEGNVLKELCIG